jgi:hypothetical protein
MRRSILRVVFGAVLALPLAASASTWTFGGALNSNQETASLDLPPFYLGGGILAGGLDDANGEYFLQVLFTGLTGPALAAHIHSGVIGEAGDIVIDLGSPTTDSITGLGVFSFSANLTPEQFGPAIRFGEAVAGDDTGFYVNIHTAKNPSGEIRGQIIVTSMTPSPVPIPAALWLMGSGLVGVFSLRRRA